MALIAALATLALSALAAGLAPALPVVILAPWGALAGFALLDLLASQRDPGAVTLSTPDEIFVGEAEAITLRAAAPPKGLEVRLDWPAGLRAPSLLAPGAGEATQQHSLHGVQRGAWVLHRMWLRWPSAFGFWEFTPRRTLDRTIRVVPNIRLVQSGQITTLVRSALYGVKESTVQGEGSEFHQLRDFVPGMDVRAIDWKRSARKRALVAKDMLSERNHHVVLCLDTGFLMGQQMAGLSRLDHAITAALATAWAAVIGGDRVGYFAYDARPHHFQSPVPGRTGFTRMRSWSAELTPEGRETNHTLGLSALHARTPKRSLIIVFTDFVDTTSAELLLDNLATLSRRHLVVFVSLRDPELDRLTGQAPPDVDGAAQLVAAHHMLAERRLVIEKLTRLGILVLDCAPDELTPRLVSTYLDIKAREQI